MIKTGIYGGSFNPIHIGHIALAHQLLSKASLDEIWFVVSPQNPLKKFSELLDDRKRLQLVRIALETESQLKACDYEFHLPKPSYMLHTLQSLSADYPDREFSLLIGADNWHGFHNWYGYQEIIRIYPIVVYPRIGYPIDPSTLPAHVRLVDTPLYNISSTEIRNRLRQGLPIEGMVPDSILDKVKEYWK